jgi:hypothetical protein
LERSIQIISSRSTPNWRIQMEKPEISFLFGR